MNILCKIKMDDKYYDEIAKGYDLLYFEEQIKKLNFAKQNFLIFGNIVDVGCGTGISTGYYDCQIGIDPSKELLKIASEKYPKINFICATAENIPLENNFCDFVVSFTAAQNFSDFKNAITEINRITKKGFLITILKDSKKVELLKQEINKYNFKELEDDKERYFFVEK